MIQYREAVVSGSIMALLGRDRIIQRRNAILSFTRLWRDERMVNVATAVSHLSIPLIVLVLTYCRPIVERQLTMKFLIGLLTNDKVLRGSRIFSSRYQSVPFCLLFRFVDIICFRYLCLSWLHTGLYNKFY